MSHQVTTVAIRHIVVQANKPYEHVVRMLEERIGSEESQKKVAQIFLNNNYSWEQITQAVEASIGSGFTLFSKVEHPYLSQGHAIQYAIGNPVFARKFTGPEPEAALYAPLRVVVYTGDGQETFVAYDSLVDQIGQYGNEESLKVARLVEQKLDKLVEEITA